MAKYTVYRKKKFEVFASVSPSTGSVYFSSTVINGTDSLNEMNVVEFVDGSYVKILVYGGTGVKDWNPFLVGYIWKIVGSEEEIDED